MTMQYMMLIYHDEQSPLRPAEGSQLMQQYIQEFMMFTEDIVKSGHFKASNRLESAARATTVRVRDGKTVTTDGPFAETKEQLGGYYLVEAKDLDEALAIAQRIPGARFGSVEVRPIMQMNH